jgi:ribosomal protein S18 acetylase RimI-like enzyme
MQNNTLYNLLGRRNYSYRIGQIGRVYQGTNNPWSNEILERSAYLYYGLFRKIVPEPIPKVISVVKHNNEIVSYAMCWQNSLHIDDAFVLSDHSNLGWMGIYTREQYRKNGFANIAAHNLIRHLENRLSVNPTPKTPVIECEVRVLKLFEQFSNKVAIFPRGCYPSNVIGG